jgi:hypothetical protein
MDTDEIPTLAWMAFFACGPGAELADQFPDVAEYCCYGRTVNGPTACTCWRPVYDHEQQPVDQTKLAELAAGGPPITRARMCADCAYRPNSPEKSGDPTYAGDAETLEALAVKAERFWCHEGMRIPTKWIHPSGAEAPGHAGSYKPPTDTALGVPFRADGTPAELCAGWDARRRALAASTTTGEASA